MNETLVVPMKFSLATEGVLRIDRIGAGVGIIMYSRANKTGVGIHVLRGKSPQGQAVNPAYYADTIIPYVVKQLQENGVMPPYSIAIAGGAAMMNAPEKADMGSRLVQCVKEAFVAANLDIKLEEVGGSKIRTMLLNVDAGKIKIE